MDRINTEPSVMARAYNQLVTAMDSREQEIRNAASKLYHCRTCSKAIYEPVIISRDEFGVVANETVDEVMLANISCPNRKGMLFDFKAEGGYRPICTTDGDSDRCGSCDTCRYGHEITIQLTPIKGCSRSRLVYRCSRPGNDKYNRPGLYLASYITCEKYSRKG